MRSFIVERDDARMMTLLDVGGEETRSRFIGAIRNTARKQDLAPDDVIVRGMWLCNSERDHYYSRFTPEALTEVAEMLPGRPVMSGHRYDQLPLGRFFHAERVFRSDLRKPKRDSYWVKGLFYMPNDDEGQRIARRIDTRIYDEVSLGWRCLDANCSMCGNPIEDRNQCPHVPGAVYDQGVADYSFSRITAVLEGSLVFAGGQKDTSMFDPGEGRKRVIGYREVPDMTMDDFLSPRDLRSSFIRGLKERFVAQVPEIGATTRQRRDDVQRVICSMTRFQTRQEAAAFVRDLEFGADRPGAGTDDTFEFIQWDASQADQTSFERKPTTDEGVEFVFAKRKPPQRQADEEVPETVDALFG